MIESVSVMPRLDRTRLIGLLLFQNMKSNKPFNLVDRLKSIGFAMEGLLLFFQSQHNALIQGVATIIVILLGFVYKISATEWCLLTFAIALVITAEMLNTAIELLTDEVHPKKHDNAKKIKDIAAGAVLIAAIAAAIIGGIIFVPKMFF